MQAGAAVPSTGAARGRALPPHRTPAVTHSGSPGSAALSCSKLQPSGLLRYRTEGTDKAAGTARAMHLLADGRAVVAHISSQVDPVPVGPAGGRGPGGAEPAQRLGTPGARRGPGWAGPAGGARRRAHVRPYVTIAAVGARPVPADRGWFELVRCHGDAAAL